MIFIQNIFLHCTSPLVYGYLKLQVSFLLVGFFLQSLGIKDVGSPQHTYDVKKKVQIKQSKSFLLSEKVFRMLIIIKDRMHKQK